MVSTSIFVRKISTWKRFCASGTETKTVFQIFAIKVFLLIRLTQCAVITAWIWTSKIRLKHLSVVLILLWICNSMLFPFWERELRWNGISVFWAGFCCRGEVVLNFVQQDDKLDRSLRDGGPGKTSTRTWKLPPGCDWPGTNADESRKPSAFFLVS